MSEQKLEQKHAHAEAQMVCPWWLCFTFDNPLRRLLQNPQRILKPYIKPGWKVLDVGPGMGYFSIPLAKLVGEKGQVIAADLQQHMLDAIRKRAAKAGVENRIKYHLCRQDSLGLSAPVDFALVFWMAHEVPDQKHFFKEIVSVLKAGGGLLLAEPYLHVSGKKFQTSVRILEELGLKVVEKPRVFISNAAVFKKG